MEEKLTNQERLAKIPNSEKAKMMFLMKKKQAEQQNPPANPPQEKPKE